jgi:hypothetical protein
VSVVRQLAQAVLCLSVLGWVAQLLAAAIADNHLPRGTSGPSTPPTAAQPPPASTCDPGTAWQRDETRGGVRPGGDVGGDAQLAESPSVRFHHRHQPGAMVTYRYYAALDLDDLATIYVEQQTELLVGTDPADPGGTEVWSHYQYTALADLPTFGSVKAATAAAKRAAEGGLACDERWSGRPPWSED